jgi:hypothetical protein
MDMDFIDRSLGIAVIFSDSQDFALVGRRQQVKSGATRVARLGEVGQRRVEQEAGEQD